MALRFILSSMSDSESLPSSASVASSPSGHGHGHSHGAALGKFRVPGSLLRVRDGHEARVSFVELFFDLIYVFAVTQLSHHLLHDLSVFGALETLVLMFGVWLAWQYSCWITNWFDPETKPVRLMLFGIMLAGLVMAAAIPHAFKNGGLAFAISYVLIQVGRTLFCLAHLKKGHDLTPNFQRMLGWLVISAVFWLSGAFASGGARLALWAVAVCCEYFSPMFGFWLPKLGRSRTSEWTVEGGHIAERCQLFVIVALGECLLITGATLSTANHFDSSLVIAFLAAFVGSLAMWWVYFDTSSKDGSEAIVHSSDPGRIAAYYHYTHVTMVAGIILNAVASELVVAHPHGHTTLTSALVLGLANVFYLGGNALYKTVVYGRVPRSHVVAVLVQLALIPVFMKWHLATAGAVATALLLVVAVWEGLCVKRVVGDAVKIRN